MPAKKKADAATPKVVWEEVELTTLIPADYNPREITPEALEGLANSIDEFGLVQGLVVNRRNNHIIGGHQRVLAMMKRGYTKAMVAWVDVDEAHEKALNVTLNNQKIEGQFVTDKLQAILEELADTYAESLDLFKLRDLGEDLGVLAKLAGGGGRTDADDVPDIDASLPPISKLGSMYECGDHFVLCGDSLVDSYVDRLLGTERVQLVVTDPPWNVAYGADSHKSLAKDPETGELKHTGSFYRAIINDNQKEEDWLRWIAECGKQLGRIMVAGGHLYLFMGAASWPETDRSLRAAGFHWATNICWVKDQFVMSAGDYHHRWEPIWYGWKEGAARRCPLADRTQDDVWEWPRPRASELHPMTKPVELLQKAIVNSSKKGDVVADLFGGSGSTLIACENLQRRCRTMDLDPRYADVIVQRWTDFTGREAYLLDPERGKVPWSQLVSERGVGAPIDQGLRD